MRKMAIDLCGWVLKCRGRFYVFATQFLLWVCPFCTTLWRGGDKMRRTSGIQSIFYQGGRWENRRIRKKHSPKPSFLFFLLTGCSSRCAGWLQRRRMVYLFSVGGDQCAPIPKLFLKMFLKYGNIFIQCAPIPKLFRCFFFRPRCVCYVFICGCVWISILHVYSFSVGRYQCTFFAANQYTQSWKVSIAK